MYFEEKIIDGVLCFRTTPKAQFQPYTAEMLTKKIVKLTSELKELYTYICWNF